ncbi:MAG TPA: hypothetical protein PLP19_01240 [bacterium]|nr:hypothetical protein [bacterium]HPN42088.1 hypothetical protein [bacterium]
MNRYIISFIFILALVTVASAMDISINKSTTIRDGKKKNGGMTTINGNLNIGDDCRVTGACRTVNGNIDIGDNTTVKKLQTVNGGVTIGRNSRILTHIETVNGFVTCNPGVEILGSIKTVNAMIELDSVRVKRNITTYTGNIYLQNGSIVERDLVVKHSHNKNNSYDNWILKLTLSGGSIIEGDVIVRAKDIKVMVTLREGSKIMGKVKNAQVVYE